MACRACIRKRRAVLGRRCRSQKRREIRTYRTWRRRTRNIFLWKYQVLFVGFPARLQKRFVVVCQHLRQTVDKRRFPRCRKFWKRLCRGENRKRLGIYRRKRQFRRWTAIHRCMGCRVGRRSVCQRGRHLGKDNRRFSKLDWIYTARQNQIVFQRDRENFCFLSWARSA